jgi:excisionase family DNA binding protein
MSLQDTYITAGQAAALLNVSRLTVWRWVKSEKLSGERVGRITLIPRAEVEELARERQVRESLEFR